MRLRRKSFTGFTLIELLIVVGVMGILSAFAMDLTTRLAEAGRRIEERANAVEAGNAALGRWREDVAFARSIAVAEDSTAMTIGRAGGDGAEVSVVYSVDERRRLTREVGGRSELLVESVADLSFTAQGRGWRAQWVVETGDGIQTWRRPIGGLGAPIMRQR